MELSPLFPLPGGARRSQYTLIERNDSYPHDSPPSSSASSRRRADPASGSDDISPSPPLSAAGPGANLHARTFEDSVLSARYSVSDASNAKDGAQRGQRQGQGQHDAGDGDGDGWTGHPGTIFTRKKLGFAGLAISALLLLLSLVAMLTSAGLARMRATLSRSTPFKTVTHAETPSPLWGAVAKPYPTGAFWTNLVVKNGEGPVALHPYGIKCLDSGVHVSYGASRRSVTQAAIIDTFASDWQINSLEAYTGRSVERYDNGSVTMGYTTAPAAGAATGMQVSGKYRAYLVKGAPFVTVAFENATPVLSSSLMKILTVDARVKNNVPGVQYIVTLGNFQKWLVYCSEPVVLVWKDNALTSPVPIRGVIRVALLPAQAVEASFTTLMMYVQKYPIGMQTTFTYATGASTTDKSAVQAISFQTQGTGNLLMLALPHHIKSMLPGVYDTADSIAAATALSPLYSMKGKLRPIVGDCWRMQFTLPAVSWNYALAEKLGEC